MHVLPALLSVCMYFSVLGLQISVSKSSIYTCLYLSEFPILACMSLYFQSLFFYAYFFQFFDLCVCILQTSVYICLYLSLLFPVFILLFPTLHFMCLYFQNLNSKCLCLPITVYKCLYFSVSSLCVEVSQSCLYMSGYPNFDPTMPILHIIQYMYGCVSKFSAYMFMYFQICSLYVYIFHASSFASFTCVNHSLFLSSITVHILVIPLHGIFHN